MSKTVRQQQIARLRAQQGRDPFYDAWEADFDKNLSRALKSGLALWVTVVIANLIVWGVVIWAIVQLVQWIQTK